jgi:hypothetical protein
MSNSGAAPSGNPSDDSADRSVGGRRGLLFLGLVIFAVAVFVIALVLLRMVWEQLDDTQAKSLKFESGKILLQVMGVVVLGAIFSAWVTTLTLTHQRDESNLARSHRNWERDVDLAKDERRRVDEIRRALLDSTIESYNVVKRSRRRLRAAGYNPPVSQARKEEADKQKASEVCIAELEQIIGAELEFERLNRLLELADMDPKDDLEKKYQACIKYLKEVFDDYEKTGEVPLPGEEDGDLRNFVAHRGASDGFKKFGDPAKEAMRCLRTKLKEPLDLPR